MPMVNRRQRATDYTFKNRPTGSVSVPLDLEAHMARAELGLSLAEYDALPGTSRYVDFDNPTMTKSDVIAIYRLSKLVDSIYQDMAMPKKKNNSPFAGL